MQCLFGTGASEEDITGALDGTGESTPTEQEIRDCFTPLYNTGSAKVLQLRLAVLRLVRQTNDDEGESSTGDGTSDDEGETED